MTVLTDITVTFENETGALSGATKTITLPPTGVTWLTSGGSVVTWTTPSGGTATWGVPGLVVFGPYAVGALVGRLIGMTLTTSIGDFVLIELVSVGEVYSTQV